MRARPQNHKRWDNLGAGVHVSKCTAGVPPARGRLAGREDEGGRDARGTLWATHLLTCTRGAVEMCHELERAGGQWRERAYQVD